MLRQKAFMNLAVFALMFGALYVLYWFWADVFNGTSEVRIDQIFMAINFFFVAFVTLQAFKVLEITSFATLAFWLGFPFMVMAVYIGSLYAFLWLFEPIDARSWQFQLFTFGFSNWPLIGACIVGSQLRDL